MVRVKRNFDSGVYKCVIKNDSGMDETSATITVKKVESKKKKEEEEVEETIEIDDEDLPAEVKRGPFGVLLHKATIKKSVISVSSRSSKFRVVSVVVHMWDTFYVNVFLYVFYIYMWLTLFFAIKSAKFVWIDF